MTIEEFTAALTALDQNQLRKIMERRHPFYEDRMHHWEFCEGTYDGGRDWFDDNIFQFYKEGDDEYNDRVLRAYRPNHTREVVELVNKYLFKAEIVRKDDAPDFIQNFWNSSTLTRKPINTLARLVSGKSSIFGKTWVVVDSIVPTGVATKADEAAGDARVYAYNVKPQDALDMAFDDDGDLSWFFMQETSRDDDFLAGSGAVSVLYRLLTPMFWATFDMTINAQGEKVYAVASTGEHGLGLVPVIPVDHIDSENLYWAPGLIDDVAYMDRAVANYLSNIDAIIQDQTFSQLVIPAQAMMPGDDGEEKVKEIGTKRIFTYDAQAGIGPEFISPDPRQANLILSIINKIIGEIYQTVGMSGERTKQDNATGIDNSSGVAKAYDFERMNAMLASKAQSLEAFERRLVGIVRLYNDDGDALSVFKDGESDLVDYPGTFDVRGLYDEFEIAAALAMMDAPPMVRQQQMEALVDKLFPSLAQDMIQKIKDSITVNWPPAAEQITGPSPMPPFVVPPKPGAAPGSSSGAAGKGNTQGENNKPAPKTSATA